MHRSLPIFSTPTPARSPAGVVASKLPVAEITSPRTVRLSLTDRCDLACVYCRPDHRDGYLPAEDRLDVDGWRVMIEGLVASGVRRVRITGGEPLLHPQIVEITRMIASFPIVDLALTTNATQLASLALPLKRAGLHRVTVSLDTLDAARFKAITRGGVLAQVLAGVEALGDAGFEGTKLNVVVVRGENDHELEALTHWAWQRRITPRFLEIMAIGEGARLANRLVRGDEMRARLGHLLVDREPSLEPDRGPAKYLAARHDSSLRVGFITGSSHTYCAGCDRLRVTSDGVLRPCLATSDGVAATSAARSGDVDGVRDALVEAWRKKPDGDVFKGCTEEGAAKLSIRAIGG